MSQRCLEFDTEIVCNEQMPDVTPSNQASGTKTVGRPVRVPPCGIGLHLNSLGGFMTPARGNQQGVKVLNSRPEPGVKVFGATPACSAGSELVSGIDNNEQEQNGVDSKKRDELNCIQSCSLSETSFLDDNSRPGGKRRLLDLTATYEDVIVRTKRRRRGAPDGCKQCSCKKSKCLKLYCECFASGTYCSASCGCKGCSNKEEFEDVVFEVREQIQSRNPLAFIPKVVASTVSTYTEASDGANGLSKHKKGCSCKKSQCLKKYCECYQVEVGCSPSCKCVGCMNTFGAKQVITRKDEGKYQPPLDLGNEKEIVLGSPVPSSLLRAMSSVATEDQTPMELSARNFESPIHQTPSTCSKTASNFGTPFQAAFAEAQVSPEFSVSRSATCEKPRTTMVTRSSKALKPGFHTLRGTAVEEDDLPEFLMEPAEVQSGTVSSSPKKKRVTPPQVMAVGGENKTPPGPTGRNSRKISLQALPSLPPVSSFRTKKP